jgi:shikimate dehydrogenase
MKRVLLLGHPVDHSLSPLVQQAAFDHERLPVRYELRDVPARSLAAEITALRADPEVIGVNLTIPHKEAIVPLLDSIGEDAERVGAVNTIVRAGSRLIGRNTDIVGFRSALDALVDERRPPRSVLLLGAGGGARAVLAVLATSGAVRVAIANRHLHRGERLARTAAAAAPHLAIRPIPWHDSTLADEALHADLIINATSLGLHDASPLPLGSIRKGQYVIDLAYGPNETPLVRAARAAGAEAADGREMLLGQGAAAFSLWTGRSAPLTVMRKALESALESAEQRAGGAS